MGDFLGSVEEDPSHPLNWLRSGTFPSSINGHVEQSETSPPFMFSRGSFEGAMSNSLN
jgi:hypothetical protein